MMTSVDEVLKYIATNEIRWVDLQFFDVNGLMHKTTISNRDVDEQMFSKGIAAADLYDVFGRSEQGELALLPDANTVARLPWEPSSIRLLCDVVTNPNTERYPKDCRYVSERVETNLSAIGIKSAKIGASLEFYIFETVTTDRTTSERGAGTIVDTREASWNPSPLSGVRNGAFVSQPYDSLYAARNQIAETMEDAFGFFVDGHRHGRSPTGQQNIDIQEYTMKTASDAISTLKFVVRNLANAVNAGATFMPYPVKGEKGSSLAIHQSLWKTADSNMFYDGTDEYSQLSQAGRYYIGGILEHAAALCLFTNPTTNSYKRMTMDKKVVGWSKDNRKALVLAPFTKKNAKEVKRVVFNNADPSVNPYLAYSAIIAAGIDGIKNKIDPGDPLSENEEEAKKRKWNKLPNTLYEAVEALETDPKFIKGVIPTELLGDYLDSKLQEFKDSQKSISAWEMERYWNV